MTHIGNHCRGQDGQPDPHPIAHTLAALRVEIAVLRHTVAELAQVEREHDRPS